MIKFFNMSLRGAKRRGNLPRTGKIASLVARNDNKGESGQILVLTLIALGVVLFTVLFVIAGAQVYFLNASYSIEAEKATALAEAAADKAVASLNKTGGSYNGETETFLGEGSFAVIITNKDAGTKLIRAIGYLPNKEHPKTKRTITTEAAKGVGVSFVYGLQVGEGGIQMGTGTILNGSIYSNGNIISGNNATFSGDVWVAGAAQAEADQQSDCTAPNCQDYIFGKSVGGENRQDVAQSFKSAADGILNKVFLKLQKAGSPANPTVRIMSDASGKPNKNGVLATGILSASLVSTQPPPSFTDVTFDSAANLEKDTTYWIMIHASSLDNSNYWIWSLDLAQGYPWGLPKWSAFWGAGNPSWTAISGDLGFKTYMGGAATSVNLGNGSVINGDVHANTIAGSMVVTKDAYYQTLGSSVIVEGAQYPASADPVPTVFPVSDANITAWRNEAEGLGVSSGDILNCVAVLGPGKIAGNVSLGSSCNTKVVSPLWITGALNVGNSSKLTLDQNFGAASGLLLVDGKTILGNGVDLLGSGTTDSYLMLFSTYNSKLNGDAAMDIGNSAISGILYAPYGKVDLRNGASFKEIVAWGIELGTDAVLNYQSGLSSVFFTSGPTGSYSLVKGTYQVK